MAHYLNLGNAENDQKWARPALTDSWGPETHNLIFQQIDVEEGHMDGKTTVRLFGVTEVKRKPSCVDQLK